MELEFIDLKHGLQMFAGAAHLEIGHLSQRR
jgi:hypothetical protein